MKAKQIEWEEPVIFKGITYRGRVRGEIVYYLDCDDPQIDVKPWEASHIYTDGGATITWCDTPDQAKQACQDHLQQHVDGLLLELQQLMEE